MLDFIPTSYYVHIFFNLLLFINLFTLLHNYILPINDYKNLAFMRTMGILLLVFVLVYMGLRPVSYIFVDMVTYAAHYDRYLLGSEIRATHDVTFHYFMKFCSYFLSKTGFFFLCVLLYLTPMFVLSKKLFKQYWYYSFLMLVGSFSFWAYGVNGIRNGIATSMFLMAFAYRDKKILLILFLSIASLFHKTMLLPTIAYIATLFYNNPKSYLIFWLVSIPLSLALGSAVISLFASLGFGDDRISGYLSGNGTSFRWDFLLYSASAVFAGYYFIFKKGFKDKVYHQLFNIYLFCNGFWVLVIKANFSNRFAYLSWFMIAIIIVYPYLKQRFFENQNIAIGKMLLAYFGFTYLMFLVYNS